MWVITQISEIETEVKRLPSEQFTAATAKDYQDLVDRGLKLQGKLELLEEMYNQLGLKKFADDPVVYHNDY